MAHQKLPSHLDVDEAAFEAMFSDIENNPEICSLEQIDPSRAGWEVILHFDDSDPKSHLTETGRDYWKLEQWSALGHFQLTYARSPNPVVTLTHSEDCTYNCFSAEEIALMNKYRPLAKAAQEIRRRIGPPPLPVAVSQETAADVDDVMEVADDEYDTVSPEDSAKLASLNFVVVAINLPKDLPQLEDVLNDLEWVAAEEDLQIQIEMGMAFVEVYFSKKDHTQYDRVMLPVNVQMIEKLGFSLID